MQYSFIIATRCKSPHAVRAIHSTNPFIQFKGHIALTIANVVYGCLNVARLPQIATTSAAGPDSLISFDQAQFSQSFCCKCLHCVGDPFGLLGCGNDGMDMISTHVQAAEPLASLSAQFLDRVGNDRPHFRIKQNGRLSHRRLHTLLKR